ncbi:TlpA disulfide reductase family protein [Lacibacter sp.]|uniref:TlpA family protein disulfide reductase n=1 Tax=Lacibacter sp. TaxID=1915409 RepID=UPI002B4B7803|nr:TlpA disulfide reductase family protein [Lacibacter sp.]HLP37725.1 TlpA disulfide reductase family protein [Lacibacter sp.]
MKRFSLWLGMLLPALFGSGQEITPLQPLSIGDAVPKLALLNLMNSPVFKSNLTNYNNKLLIIDFWATYCSPCIPGLYKLDSMQQLFKDDVQVLAVTYQPKKTVDQFLKRRKWNIVFAAEDTLLKQLFPYHSMPHTVWIQNGIVKAFTSSSQVTANNIRRLLETGTADVDMKLDDVSFNNQWPLFVKGNGGDGSQQLYRSMFAPYMPGLRLSLTAERKGNGQVSRISMINVPLLTLFKEAWAMQYPWLKYDNRLLVEVKDSTVLFYNKHSGISKEEWSRRNSYCYTLDVPQGFKGNLPVMMQEELNRFFGGTIGLTAALVKQKRRCLVLRCFDKALSEAAATDKANSSLTADSYLITNLPFAHFYSGMLVQHRNSALPVIDATGITGHVRMELPANFRDVAAMQKALAKYGLTLCEEDSETEVLLIKQQ